MKLWLYTDAEGRLLGLNPHDLTGSTGWQEAKDASLLGDDPINTSLTDSRDIARYKVVDGIVLGRTQEEMNADYVKPEPPPAPSGDYEARISALETDKANQADVDALAESIERGLNL